MAAVGQSPSQPLLQTMPAEMAMQSESDTHERSYDEGSISTQPPSVAENGVPPSQLTAISSPSHGQQ